jgi:hypothetical protein
MELINLAKTNRKPTLDPNALPKRQKWFYERAKRICEEGTPFCSNDFKPMKESTFRYYILQLRPLLEVVISGRPAFYKIKGIELSGDSHKLTKKDMGGGQFFALLDSLKLKDPAIHDISFKIVNSDLHAHLLKSGTTVDPSNNSFRVNCPQPDNNIQTKVRVYPESIVVYLGCTYKPLTYDFGSLLYLHEYLSKISYHLSSLGNGVLLPPVSAWICTKYHFGKDGSREYSGATFHFTVNDVIGGMIRFYSKKMKNGELIPRLEQNRSPHRSLEDEMKHAIGLEDSDASDENEFNNNRPCFVTNFPVFCF